MYTIENEFDECIQSIRTQTYKDYDYFIIEKLPNKKAHESLYERFMNPSDEYDLFIKIDADMVLHRPSFFGEVVDEFKNDPDLDDLEIAISDFFTNRLIYGLHIFSNRVKWNKISEKIFVDKSTNQGRYRRDGSKLAPAAYHCPNPSLFQSFRYGLHKMLKVIQTDNQQLNYMASMYHWNNIINLKDHYLIAQDERLLYALLGVIAERKGKYDSTYTDFDNPNVEKLFDYYANKGSDMNNTLIKNSTKWFNILPDSFHLNLILYKSRRIGFLQFLKKNLKNEFSRYRENFNEYFYNSPGNKRN